MYPRALGLTSEMMRSRTLSSLLAHSQAHTTNISSSINKRLYVRAVDWSNPAGVKAPKKKRWIPECSEKGKRNVDNMTLSPLLAPKFGIIAAMTKNHRIIGIDGKLPWTISEDRRHFEDITRGKVLIIGRNTLGERDDGTHIDQVRKCIVVSTTLDPCLFADTEKIIITKSFEEALRLAKRISASNTGFRKEGDGENDAIDCWVGGGERIYEEALKHPNAQEVHLTEIDLDIALNSGNDVAKFPRKYTWDRHFSLSEKKEGIDSGKGDLPKYTFMVYKR